jgi:mono/diheme cytochrome c family protein
MALALLTAMVAGTTLILLGVLAQPWRWPMLASGAVLWLLAMPWLGIFTVKAYPTSFYASPTGFSVQSIAAGEALFLQNCSSCHGPDGHGDGPAAKDRQPPPADLTAAHIYAHSDGDLFWWITHGIGDAMPALVQASTQPPDGISSTSSTPMPTRRGLAAQRTPA